MQPLREYGRLIRNGVARQPARALAILLFSITGVLAQMGVILVLSMSNYFYTQIDAGYGDSARLPAFTTDVRVTIEQFLGVSPGVFYWIAGGMASIGLLLLSNVLIFASAKFARRIARDFHSEAIDETLVALRSNEHVSRIRGPEGIGQLQQMIMQNTLHASKALETTVRAGQAIVFFLVGITFALLIQPSITVILAVVGLIYLPVVFWSSQRIKRNADEFYNLKSQNYGRYISKTVGSLDAHIGVEDHCLDDAETEREKRIYLDSYDDLQLAGERMTIATGFVRILIFGVLIVSISYAIFVQQMPTSEALAFVGILYFTLSFLQQTFSSVATMSIFSPQLSRYYAFRDDVGLDPRRKPRGQAGDSLQAETVPIEGGTPIRIRGNALEDETRECDIDFLPGALIELVVSERPGRLNMGQWLGPLTRQSEPSLQFSDICMIRSGFFDWPELSLKVLDDRLASASGETFEAFCDTLQCGEDLRNWIDVEEQDVADLRLGQAVLMRASGAVRSALTNAICISSRKSVVALDENNIARNHKERREYLLQLYGSKRLILFNSTNDETKVEVSHGLLVTASGKLLISEGRAVKRSFAKRHLLTNANGGDNGAADVTMV